VCLEKCLKSSATFLRISGGNGSSDTYSHMAPPSALWRKIAFAFAAHLSLRKRVGRTKNPRVIGAVAVLDLDWLFECQRHLPQVVGHMVGSTQQYSQSVPGRIFGIIFFGHGVVLQ
jgi:hypothetical protein